MEDAATAEISRAQIWQWIRHPRGVLTDGRKVTKELFRSVLGEELDKIAASLGAERFARRARIFDRSRATSCSTNFYDGMRSSWNW